MSFKFFTKELKNYHWQSFFAKFFAITFSLLSILIAVIFTMYIAFSYSAAKKDTLNNAKQTILKTENFVNRLMDETVSNYSKLTTQEDWQLFFFLPKEEIAKNYGILNNVKHDISISATGNDQINSIYIYSRLNGYVISSSKAHSTSSLLNFDDCGWCNYGEIPTSEMIKSRTVNQNGFEKKVITFIKPFYYGNKLSGCYVVNFDAKAVENSILSAMNENYPCKVSLCSLSGTELCSAGDIKEFEDFHPNIDSSSSAPQIEMCGKNHLAGYAKLQNYQTCIKIFSKISLEKTSNLATVFIFFIIVALFVSMIIAFLLTSKFYGIVLNIMDILKFPTEEESVSQKQKKGIGAKFEKLFSAGNYAEKELAQKINKFKHLHSVSLQSQLNPHFIYNVLHLISSYEMMEHKCDTNVTVAISLFSELLRGVLDNKNTFVPLKEELELSEKYLNIANMLVINKFDVEVDVPDDLLDKQILKLTLQPILENAVNHGLRRIKRKGIIKISARALDGSIVITITDNGCGMKEEELSNLNQMLENPFEVRNKHLGLYNTNQRISLIYGEDFGCKVFSSENGTKVVITVADI